MGLLIITYLWVYVNIIIKFCNYNLKFELIYIYDLIYKGIYNNIFSDNWVFS